jgi:hypothetical protein
MIKKNAIWIGLTLSLVGLVSASSARADDLDKKTVLTFSEPVEIPGVVLPAGTYTFKLANAFDRHIVQIFNADGSQIIATVMTIPDYRLTATDETVIKFSEVPYGSTEAIRAWFYPGNTVGEAFVYSKRRAMQLAKASKVAVPAIAADTTDADALKTASIVAVTPDERELPVTAAIQTTPSPIGSSYVVGTAGVTETGRSARRDARELPETASALPRIVLFGLGAIGVAFGLMAYGKRASGSAV